MKKNELTTANEFSAPAPAPAGSMLSAATGSREIQSVQVAMLAAKRFPRDEKAAIDRILNACCREGLASVAQYQFARGGTDICGPSIRLAEALAQSWGNIESGWRELSREAGADGCGVSTVEAFAWDLESNYRVPRVFSVRHWRDTQKGGYALKDERDIYELCANQAARRLRACLLAVLPGDVVESAIAQCNATLQSNADTGPEARAKMLESFAALGVSREQIEGKIQRRLDSITPAQLITLRRVHASIRDGMSEPKDWFESAAQAAGKAQAEAGGFDPFNQAPAQPEARPATFTGAAGGTYQEGEPGPQAGEGAPWPEAAPADPPAGLPSTEIPEDSDCLL